MKRWMWGMVPLLLLGLVLVALFRFGPLGVFQAAFPPVENLTIDRIILPERGRIVVHLTNGGPDPVRVAQVLVDEAYWRFESDPPNKLVPRLGKIKLYLDYPWVEGEMHEVTILTSTGVTFSSEIAVATRSPQANWTYFWSFALLGTYAGVIPVFLGLLWYPFLRHVSEDWLSFFLSLTAGLLVFLAIDTLSEAFEVSAGLPNAYQRTGLILSSLLVTLLFLLYLSRSRQSTRGAKSTRQGRFWTAWMISLGIGLHNMGEGLAIGSAYALGEISLGLFLVVGFMLHNVTEGLGIVTPVARERPSFKHFLLFGAVAGLPTILGTWLGGFSYSAYLATVFLSIGAGAILQVLIEIGALLSRQGDIALGNAHKISGFVAGLAVMYLTGLFVIA